MRHGAVKALRAIVCALIICFLFSLWIDFGRARAQDSTPPTPPVTDVIAAVPGDFPPQYAIDERGEPVGFAIDVMDQVASKAGLNVHYLAETNWRDANEAVRTGRADLIPNNGVTSERAKDFAFTLPVETFAVSIFVRTPTTDIQTETDLAGREVAVVETNVAVNLLEDREDVHLTVFTDVNQALFALLSGQADALVYPEPTVLIAARSLGLEDNIKVVGDPLVEIERAMSLRHEDTDLLERLNRAISHFVGTPEYRGIYVKWYGEPQPFWTAVRVGWLMGGLLLLTLIGMAAWRYGSLLALNQKLARTVDSQLRTEETLRESETKYRQLVELAQEGIWMLDQDSYTTFVNPSMARMLGYAEDEMIGKHLFSFMDESLVGMAKRNLERRRQGITEQHEFEFLRKDGTRVITTLVTAPLFDSDGEYTGALAGVIDVTQRKKAQEEMNRTSETLQETSRIAKIGGWAFDPETGEGTWTDEVARIHELDPNTDTNVEIGMSFYHGESRRAIQAAVKDAIESGVGYDLELEIVTAKGNRKWVRTIGQPIKEGGKVARVQGTFQDITQRKQVEEQIGLRNRELVALNRLATRVSASLSTDQVISAALDEAVAATGADLALFFLREGDELHLAGMGPDDSKHCLQEIPIHAVGECLCGLAVSLGRPLYSHDIYSDPRCTWEECKNAGLRSLVGLPLRHGETVSGLLGLASGQERDFSKQSEFLETMASGVSVGLRNALLFQQVQRHAEELEQRVTERTAELEVALDRAEGADRLKSAFLATMSHELRTPLNSIIGFTGVMLQHLAGPLNDEQTKQLRMVQHSARHLLELINDVLDLSKIEAGQLEIDSKPFDVPTVVEEAVESVMPLVEKKNLRLSVQVGPEVGEIVSDRRRTQQILMNLLSNALKFTEVGEVRVECQITDGWLTTKVIDTGIGIRPEDLDRLFAPFQQLEHGLARQHEGTGLGLSICRRLVELLGGQIWVESEPGVGSTFAFRLPL